MSTLLELRDVRARYGPITALHGVTLSVEEGTTNLGFLKDESKKLVAAGKKAIDIVGFPKDTDAANALKTGKVDAYFADSPVAVYYHIQDPSTFGVQVQPINPIPVGMAFRKTLMPA